MKVLVTGIAGAIGSHLAERLIDLGHEVVGIDALTEYYSPEIKRVNAEDVIAKGGKVHFLNLTKDDFEPVLKGVEVIFHCAAQPGISSSTSFEHYLDNNITATHRLLQKAAHVPTLKAFIYVSTSSVYGARANGDETTEPKPTSYYGVTKLAAEQLAMSYYREHGLPVTVIRLFSVYGERERPEKLYHKLIKTMLEEGEFTLYEGSEYHVRSYTYIKDIIDGCIMILNNLDRSVGEIFNLGNDKTMTTGEGIKIIERIVGKPARFITLPRRAGDQIETAANISKMRKMFGYNPSVSLEEGLANQVKWYKEKIHKKIK